jgi:Ca2+-binding EF-hand superfamily protein
MAEFTAAFEKLFKKAALSGLPKEWCAEQVRRIAEAWTKAHGSIEGAFAALDLNKSGKLSDKEFAKGTAAVGLTYTKEEIGGLIVHMNAGVGRSSSTSRIGIRAFKQALADASTPVAVAATSAVATTTTAAFYSSLLASIARTFAAHTVQLRRFFRTMDTDGTGAVSLNEFRIGMRIMNEMLPTRLSDEQVAKLFNIIDQDSSGSITFQEFMAGFAPPAK